MSLNRKRLKRKNRAREHCVSCEGKAALNHLRMCGTCARIHMPPAVVDLAARLADAWRTR